MKITLLADCEDNIVGQIMKITLLADCKDSIVGRL